MVFLLFTIMLEGNCFGPMEIDKFAKSSLIIKSDSSMERNSTKFDTNDSFFLPIHAQHSNNVV